MLVFYLHKIISQHSVSQHSGAYQRVTCCAASHPSSTSVPSSSLLSLHFVQKVKVYKEGESQQISKVTS